MSGRDIMSRLTLDPMDKTVACPTEMY